MILLLALAAIGGGACSDNEATIHVLPTVSGTFTDERDGTEYHWVRLGGLDWMTENLRYVPETGVFAPDLTEPYPGYYDDGQDTLYYKLHGGLYDYETALAAVPEGWRLPTDEDWKKLERYLGMAESEVERENDWRGTTEGALLKEGEHGIGFNALFGGGKMYTDGYSNWYDNESFSRKGQNAYFWTSTTRPETDSTEVGVIRSMAVFTDQILRTTTRLVNEDGHPTMFSVRLVKNKE